MAYYKKPLANMSLGRVVLKAAAFNTAPILFLSKESGDATLKLN